MTNAELTSLLLVLLLLVALAHLLGSLFVRLRQPRVVGEILAGVVLGPAVVGRFAHASLIADTLLQQGAALSFVYWLGLLLLMTANPEFTASLPVPPSIPFSRSTATL